MSDHERSALLPARNGLSPFAPERAAIRAGRIVLEQIHSFGRNQWDFGFDSTLSGKTQIKLLRDFKKNGYNIHIFIRLMRTFI